ncbi:putative membrane protein [Microvirga lupini]|uniref:Putative membrane protein n=1 Tax=Microvirga lupini TaxID=420324 RepID=A0A7W4YVZ3_9HYPH|nr:putative membrane protein [Microvirga lupini]
MVALSHSGDLRPLHPLHAILLAFPLPLFAGALASDLAYRASFHIQWANFSSWLIAGGLVGGGFALLWALINLFRRGPARKGRLVVYFIVLLAMWGLGFVNALIHAKDAWATMPEGLYLSAITTLLALVAAWVGYSGFRTGEVK